MDFEVAERGSSSEIAKNNLFLNADSRAPRLSVLDAERKLPTRPWELTPSSNKSAWWRCPQDSTHVWRMRVNTMQERYRAGSCPCPHCRKKELV
ncbi:MAG: zinc-ribbon domain-containing protein [Candidatus Melainabacteria bacterium]|nr:zinc-ribbon domain-containing protein [Candidatus Melainabacteria bacterium]